MLCSAGRLDTETLPAGGIQNAYFSVYSNSASLHPTPLSEINHQISAVVRGAVVLEVFQPGNDTDSCQRRGMISVVKTDRPQTSTIFDEVQPRSLEADYFTHIAALSSPLMGDGGRRLDSCTPKVKSSQFTPVGVGSVSNLSGKNCFVFKTVLLILGTAPQLRPDWVRSKPRIALWGFSSTSTAARSNPKLMRKSKNSAVGELRYFVVGLQKTAFFPFSCSCPDDDRAGPVSG
tara:strand:- start:59 stop:757 length:699 start_codon:yes stop_codon:yes gene_type:complete